MEYQMKKIGTKYPNNDVLRDMYCTIMMYIKGEVKNIFAMTERARQFYTWGARQFKYVVSDDGCYGIQFNVSGLRHRGRVRIYYNPSTDYFDVELLRSIKNELVWGCEDVDFVQLHNILHKHIEREDDMVV